jgi:endonuclease-3
VSADTTNPTGSYVLLITLDAPTTLEIGALGTHTLSQGGYAYVGSALGPGGLGRVDRHAEVARGGRDVKHWHVDYLLGHPDATLADTVRLPGEAVECRLATTLVEEVTSTSSRSACPVTGFGASDCACDTHLVHRATIEGLERTVEAAVSQVTDR